MNGGVSLAVWMGGVTHEIDLLRRAASGTHPPAQDDPDYDVYEAWRSLCQTLQVTVKIDIIAGTSAGGLNGTLLAAAMSRGASLPPLQEVWRDVAQLDESHLLRPPSDGGGPENAASVLSGDFFREQVRAVFRGVEAPEESRPQDVTLFVTSTAIGSQPRTILDRDGTPFVVQDHRRLYKFPPSTKLIYSPPDVSRGRGASFAPAVTADDLRWCDDSDLLAHAARASASFPVAFPPVPEVRFVPGGRGSQLAQFRMVGTGDAWLVDGGVLDNAPFGPVLDEIARAPIDTPRKRALVYVVPSVDQSAPSSRARAAPGWQRVLASALSFPREADLRDDIDAVMRHSQEADSWANGPQRLFAELRMATREVRAGYRAAAERLLEQYRTARTQGGISDALWLWAQSGSQARSGLGDMTLTGLVEAEGWVPPVTGALTVGDQWLWGTAVADRVLRLFLRDLYDRPQDQQTSQSMRDVSGGLLQIAAVRDAVEQYVAEYAPDADPTADAALSVVNDAILLLGVPDTLNSIVQAAGDACAAVLPGVATAADLIEDALVVEVVTGAFTADRAFSRPVAFDFFRFGPDIGSPDVVVTDPADPNRALALGPWKLWGTHLGHFAAFGRSEWRDHDWVWGRLDGIAHLVRLLAAESDVVDEVAVEQRVREIQDLFLKSQSLMRQDLVACAESLAGVDNDQVLARWSRDEAGLDAILDVLESALTTMRDRENGNNPAVAAAGVLLTQVLARQLPDDVKGLGRRTVHWATRGVRKRLVEVLRNADSVDGAS